MIGHIQVWGRPPVRGSPAPAIPWWLPPGEEALARCCARRAMTHIAITSILTVCMMGNGFGGVDDAHIRRSRRQDKPAEGVTILVIGEICSGYRGRWWAVVSLATSATTRFAGPDG